MRVLPPFYEADGKKIGGQFVCVRRNELSVALDIRSDEGKMIFYELIKQSDIFVESLVWFEERYGAARAIKSNKSILMGKLNLMLKLICERGRGLC